MGYTRGLDISHLSNITDWAAVAEQFSFIYIKATEKSSFIDPMFMTNVRNAKAAGMLVGAYHFYRTNSDPVVQANFFLQEISKVDGMLDLPNMVDVETNDGGNNLIYNLETFISTANTSVLYTGPAFWNENFGQSNGTKLFIANYGVDVPKIPSGWTDWTFWQYDGDTDINGAGNVDLDYFNGTLDQIKAL